MKGSDTTIPIRPAGRPDRPPDSAPAGAFLEVLSGPEDGRFFEIAGPVTTIGRMEDNDVCIPMELSVSRHHARLVRGAAGYSIEVLGGARNAAVVDGVRVEPGESAPLPESGRFLLGDVFFELGAATP